MELPVKQTGDREFLLGAKVPDRCSLPGISEMISGTKKKRTCICENCDKKRNYNEKSENILVVLKNNIQVPPGGMRMMKKTTICTKIFAENKMQCTKICIISGDVLTIQM